jgi:uncharacterized protein YecE (DUF72 family)
MAPNALTSGGRILVGTSGYAYAGWAEAGFYPRDARPGRMLPLYADVFPAVELAETWHQMPRAEDLERLEGQAPAGFRFAVKLNRRLTEVPIQDDWPKAAAAFRHNLAPLIQSGRLAAVLIQLPMEFDRSVDHRRHLAALLDALEDLPLAVEFRQGSWNQDRVFAELERRGVTLVAVDQPRLPGLFPPLNVVTNPELFYVRFHGRNARGWRSGGRQSRYDYNYWDAELREWVELRLGPMAAQAKNGLIFFTNHARAQAAQNAQHLMGLLAASGLTHAA